MLSREILLISKEAQNSASSAAILKQVLSSQATKHDVMSPNLNLAGSLKCSWLSDTLSGFSCLVSCVKMPSCSAPGCSNRSDKDTEKSLSFHNLPFRNEKLAEKWLDQLRWDAHFLTKNQRIECLQSRLQIRNVGCEDKKEETKTRCCSKSANAKCRLSHV